MSLFGRGFESLRVHSLRREEPIENKGCYYVRLSVGFIGLARFWQ